MNNLSVVRALVGAQGTWSESRRNAINSFQRYTFTKNEGDYFAIREALTIPEGGYYARIELLKEHPNLEIIKKTLIQGKIPESDVDMAIILLRNFNWIPYVKEALQKWKEGDESLMAFIVLVHDYHQIVTSGSPNAKKAIELIEQINKLNNQVTLKEKQFSSSMAEGAKWMDNLVLLFLFFIFVTVEITGLTLTVITGRGISNGLSDLNKIAHEFGEGNFDRELTIKSQDEIGQLSSSINKMGSLLKKSYESLRESHQQLEIKVDERTMELASKSEENVRLYKKAKKALKMRDEFLSIANHELRTPLTSLGLQLHILNRTVNDKNADIEKMKVMVANTSRLFKKISSLHNVLMDLSQIELGSFELKLEEGDLVAIVNESISQLILEATRNGSVVELTSPETIVGKFDIVRTGQVITNLLSNAIKYGEGKPIEVALRVDDDEAIISVKDNGPGIPLDKQAIIFERFERIITDQSRSGMGLGLYISKQVIEAHGGALELTSLPGAGATFIAKIPLG